LSGCETFEKRPLLPNSCVPDERDFQQAQILILEILNVFLWLKFSPFLALNKIEHFSKVSLSGIIFVIQVNYYV